MQSTSSRSTVCSFPGIRVTVPRAFQYPVQPERAWRLSEGSITFLYGSSLKQRAAAAINLVRATVSKL